MHPFRQDFLAYALARDVLRFGEFITKAGRRSPYFFNAGLFNDGESLRRLGEFYAEALLASGVGLIGPSVTDYEEIDELVTQLRRMDAKISFSSIRMERLSQTIVSVLG